MRRVARIALVALCAFAFLCLAATESLRNDSGQTASAVTIHFSESVRITSWDTAVFSTCSPDSGRAEAFTFSGGELAAGGRFRVSWTPSGAEATSVQWETTDTGASSDSSGTDATQVPQEPVSPTALTRAGFSLAYEVDLTSPRSNSVGVTLKIRTGGITSLLLSTSRYHPVATACEPKGVEFSAEPATGFSVTERERQHQGPAGTLTEPEWALSFAEGALITMHYERTFLREPEAGGNGVTAFLDSSLFLASGERYLVVPEIRDGEVWTSRYADALQGIVVRFMLPEGWGLWAPWVLTGNATFDPCSYSGQGAAVTNLTSLVMSTVIAGPQTDLSAFSRTIGTTDVTLVFSRSMRNLDATSEQLFRAFELVQELWGSSIDVRYLGAFPTTSYHLWSGEWTNSQGVSANRGTPAVDVEVFLHQVYHRWNGWVYGTPIPGDGHQFYGEGWNKYYSDKILNQLHVFPDAWHYCQSWYEEYLRKVPSVDAPVTRPDLVASDQSSYIVYFKGALVAYLLDHEIQSCTHGLHSLDDLVKEIWMTCGSQRKMLDYQKMLSMLLSITGEDFGTFFDTYVFGSARLSLPELR